MFSVVHNAELETVCAFVAQNRVSVENRLQGLISDRRISRLKKNTGFEAFSVASENVCTSDFCVAAAEKIFTSTNVKREKIRAIIFVTQTPDYFLPATSYLLQRRLGLSSETVAFDVGLGCTGFVHGLYIGSSLLQNFSHGKILLLCGDTLTRITSEEDTTCRSVFGDAGAAAIISKSEGQKIFFNMQSFGEFSDTIILRRGAYRNPLVVKDNSINLRENFGEMDGAAVLNFSIKYVPKNLFDLMKFADVNISQIEYFFMHQANLLMLQNMSELLGVNNEKIPFMSGRIGNTSSASIPVAMSEMKRRGESFKGLSVLSGFGVGMSVASAVIDLTNLNCLELGEL